MNKYLEVLREKTRSGYYHQFRTVHPDFDALLKECAALSDYQAQAHIFTSLAAAEKPVIIPGERLQFTRSIGCCIPRIHGGYCMDNLSPDYAMLLREGVSGRLEAARKGLAAADITDEERDFLTAAEASLNAVLALGRRYAQAAEDAGETEIAAIFRKIPEQPVSTLHEALQMIYFCNAMIRLAAGSHIGFGRMDQYLIDYYRNDLVSGKESEDSARELLAEFFLILSRDYDLFNGVQKGDNGQSVVLGGLLPDDRSGDNELTILLLDIAADLAMIEPKINLRLSDKTTPEVLKSAARLSGCGLGFPQYSNDEVVIPGLIKFGYPPEAAKDYIVAACWEFIVPGGKDIPNLFSFNLALAADRAIREGLKAGDDFDGICRRLPQVMAEMFAQIRARENYLLLSCNPLFSSFCLNALEDRKDLNLYGGRNQRHFGCHGCASSTAADSLIAVKKLVFDEKKIAPELMLEALEKDFDGFEEMRQMLKNSPYKVGCSCPEADAMLKLVFDIFADTLENSGESAAPFTGTRIRPGTGSAMNYVRMTRDKTNPGYLKTTADGRKEGEYISSSLAPAPGVKADGMLSILQSFSQIDYSRVCNGGPITMELDPVYFQSEAALDKMVVFLQAFHRSGCQQLQLNTLDPEVLKAAQKNPENYRDLIVRVWGWSGYFVELDKVYQDQIIARQTFRS